MKVIDYNPLEKVPPICERDVDLKAIVVIIENDTDYRYLGICRSARMLSQNKTIISGYCQNIAIHKPLDSLSEWYSENSLLSTISVCYNGLCDSFINVSFLILESTQEIETFIEDYQIINIEFLRILRTKKVNDHHERLHRVSRSS